MYTSFTRVISLFILLTLLQLPLAAQDAIELRSLDVSAYPEIRCELRLRDGNSYRYPIDDRKLVPREDGNPLPLTLDCPPPQPPRPSITMGFERSLDGNFSPAVTAAREFLSRVGFSRDAAEVSFWSFATTIDHDLVMTGDSAALQRTVDALSVAQWPFNGTALYECMHNAIEDVVEHGRGDARAVVFVTDGYNNTSWYSRTQEQVIGRALVDGIRVYVLLLVNREEGRSAMRALCEATGGFMLEHDVPGAADSMYADIMRPHTDNLWCSLQGTGRGCADGRTRILEFGYVRGPADTLWLRQEAVVPYREDDLQPLPVWFSPPSTWQGDTAMTVAVGVEIRDQLQPSRFTIALPLDGRQLRSGEALDWNCSWEEHGDTLYLHATPPASGLVDGFHVLARLRFTFPAGMAIPFTATLSYSASHCLRYTETSYPLTTAAALDTVLVPRGTSTEMHLHLAAQDVPEGLQRVALAVEISVSDGRFPAPPSENDLQLPQGWRLLSAAAAETGGRQRLDLLLRAVDAQPSLSASIPVATAPSAPYRIPVRVLPATDVNGRPVTETSDGMLVVRDSCYNNVVVQQGLTLSAPWPQPVRDRVSVRARTPVPRTVTIRLRDTLGRERQHWDVALQAGGHTLTLDVAALPPGRYFLHCDGSDVAGVPLTVLP